MSMFPIHTALKSHTKNISGDKIGNPTWSTTLIPIVAPY